METPTISQEQRKPFAKRAAKYSLLSPVIAMLFNMFTVSFDEYTRNQKLIVGCIIGAIYITGLFLAVIALFSIPKYGKKGILGFALAGLIINSLIIILTIHLTFVLRRFDQTFLKYSKQQLESMPSVHDNSITVINSQLGFKFELPSDFNSFQQGFFNPDVIHSYYKTIPNSEVAAVVTVIRLRGIILPEQLKESDIEKIMSSYGGVKVSQEKDEKWQKFSLQVFCSEMNINNMDVTAAVTQIPLMKEAVQINIAGPSEKKGDILDLLRYVLKSFRGKSNWAEPQIIPSE